ncbi:MAG: hypothetical protein K2Q20_06970, partial [Phycisphaerales bacterium]|nr:hypothetical protein [Phycisphaerales bacterium]
MSDTPAIDAASRRPRRRWVSVLAWTIAAPQTIPACAWLVSDESYTLDLVANLGAQFLLVAVVSLVGVAFLRRRVPAMALLLCCVLHLIPLLTGRAAFWPRAVGAAAATRSPEVVRILHYNDSTQTTPEPMARLVDR